MREVHLISRAYQREMRLRAAHLLYGRVGGKTPIAPFQRNLQIEAREMENVSTRRARAEEDKYIARASRCDIYFGFQSYSFNIGFVMST